MDLTVHLDRRGERTAAIYTALVEAMTDGRLRTGDRLPPTRELATQLGVSRTTVAAAYDRLTGEGYVEGRVGAGTFVTAAATPVSRTTEARVSLRSRRGWTFTPLPSLAEHTPAIDLRAGMPDPALFPFDTWRRLLTSEMRGRAAQMATYGGPEGHLPLREAIARHLGRSRSLLAAPEDVMVTDGAQQALDLACRVLLAPGDVVAMEDPGYPMARRLFAGHGVKVVPVPVDADGLVVERLPDEARLVFTTPSHQFPTGVAMSLSRRRALIDWADRHRAAIIEDDYDSEFRYTTRPLEPLHSLDESGRVIYVGTFSKSMMPSLRLGFMLAPSSLRPALAAARQMIGWHGVVPMQAALARFIDEGLLARHVRRASAEYARRHDAVLAGVETSLDPWFEAIPSSAGLHVCALLRPGVELDVDALVEAALAEGVGLESLRPMYAGRQPRDGLLLGYGTVQLDAVADGFSRVAELVRRSRTSA
ncbi:PLP-dependent aminotransferase family protein [Luteipulveratus mongoliensis]|uniref:GntR family transcriptional regulator n=1 Tax=Luteipulveratus mongoliensis TaxID=571913 RepID=A0A0K1JMC3_9MICO|nr:PLP-dependent aminotransferase family protein [Luteipulveratus mongoliensis]AKU17725.1 GntR family transcriptional regulator [Luteipulveratus mongoliensis]